MPTGDKRSNIYNKRLMPQEAWDLHFFRFLDDKINDTTRAAFLQSGVLSDQTIGLTGPANDVFALDISAADRVMDGYGHIMDLSEYLATTGEADVRSYFENALGVDYYVGIRYQEVANDVERNPRSAEPEYPWYQDMIGEKGAPDNVTDNVTYIRLEIDGILENGVDHSRRPVMVWLNNPVSPDDSIAYYTGTVGYSGGINYVDIPYSPTAGPLGQTAPGFPISTSALDYTVYIPGVSWFRNTDLRTDNNYAFIGIVTGAGAGNPPTIFNTSDQRPVFLISLDRAYRANSPADPAPGRTIYADKKAVRFKQSATTTGAEDWINEAFRIDQLDQNGAYASRGATVLTSYQGPGGLSSSWLHNMVLSDGVGNDLQQLEPFSALVGTGTIVFSRVGVNLLTFTDYFGGGVMVKLTGTPGATWDGFYYYGGGLLVDRFNLVDGSFSPIVFPAGVTGNVTVLAPILGGGVPDWIGTVGFFGIPVHIVNFPNYTSGIKTSMFGTPVDPGGSIFYEFANPGGGEQNPFYRLFYGRLVLRGGNTNYINWPYRDNVVAGHAQISVDKLDIADLAADWQPQSGAQEWGFDYRGGHFDIHLTKDTPGYQLGDTFRLPLWWHDGGATHIQPEEHFTVVTGDTIQIARPAFSNVGMPFDVTNFQNGVIAEVQFGSPDEADSGVYFCYSKPAVNQVELRRCDGGVPSFNLTGLGNVRFYGGVFDATIISNNLPGNTAAFMQTLASPNAECGGTRYCHRADDSIASTDQLYALWYCNLANPMFSVRDGGVVFARALTTRGPATIGNLSQWDQIDTALYTGDVSQITEIDLDNSGGMLRYIKITPGSGGDWIKMNPPGGFTGIGRAQNIHAGVSTFQYSTNWNPSTIRGLTCQVASGGQFANYTFKLDLPNNAILTGVNVRLNPYIGDGISADCLEVVVLRQSHSPGTNWLELARVKASGGSGVWQTVAITGLTETIGNSSRSYAVRIESTTPTAGAGTDTLHYCSTVMSITTLGSGLVFGN